MNTKDTDSNNKRRNDKGFYIVVSLIALFMSLVIAYNWQDPHEFVEEFARYHKKPKDTLYNNIPDSLLDIWGGYDTLINKNTNIQVPSNTQQRARKMRYHYRINIQTQNRIYNVTKSGNSYSVSEVGSDFPDGTYEFYSEKPMNEDQQYQYVKRNWRKLKSNSRKKAEADVYFDKLDEYESDPEDEISYDPLIFDVQDDY